MMENMRIEFYGVAEILTVEFPGLTKWFLQVACKMPATEYAELICSLPYKPLSCVFLN